MNREIEAELKMLQDIDKAVNEFQKYIIGYMWIQRSGNYGSLTPPAESVALKELENKIIEGERCFHKDEVEQLFTGVGLHVSNSGNNDETSKQYQPINQLNY